MIDLKGGTFDFEYEYEWKNPSTDEYEYPMLRVTGTVSDYRPAIMYGDNSAPEEGGEVEDLTVLWNGNDVTKTLPEVIIDCIMDEAIDQVDNDNYDG